MTTSLYMPDVKVEMAFGSGIRTAAASRSWTDVSAYVELEREIEIDHGRGDRLSTADANSLRLVLDNKDGRFTAGLASSPYYPNVKIGTPVRVITMIPGNLVTNPSFEVDTTGWAGLGNCTLGRSNTAPFSGTWHATMTAVAAGNMLVGTSSGTSGFPVDAGYTYAAQLRLRAATTARTCRVVLNWYTSAGVFISNTVGTNATNATGAHTVFTVTGTAPATAAFVRVDASVLSAAAGEVHYLDAVMLELGSTASAFAAGHSAGWQWQGTAHASVSLKPSYRYLGFVDEWPVEWDGTDAFAFASVKASSRMASLGRGHKLRSIVEEAILGATPRAHYPLSEGEGATVAADTSGASVEPLRQAGSGAAVTFGTATGPGTDGLTAATFSGGKYLSAPMGFLVSAGDPVALLCFVNTTAASVPIMAIGDAVMGINASGRIEATDGPTGGVVVGTGTTAINDGATHCVAWVLSDGGSSTTEGLWVDGAVQDAFSAPGGVHTILYVGGSETGAFTGTIAHAVVELSITDAQLADIAAAGLTGFAGETPGARIARYAAHAGIPTAELNADAGTSPMAHVDTTGKSVLEMMRTVEATDSGVLYDGRDGVLQYRSRSARYSAASAFSLSFATQQIGANYRAAVDRTEIQNDVTAALADGTVVARALNQASIDAYEAQGEDIELATTDENEPHAAAWWRVNTYAEPRLRVPSLGVDLLPLSDALRDVILAADVGTRFATTGAPNQAAASTGDHFIEGYTETIGPESYRFSFNVSDASVYTSVWQLDSATRSQLGTSTKLAY